MIARYVSDRQTIVWGGLVLATVMTAVLGLENHGDSSAVGALLMVIAFIKVFLVAQHFMEVRDAPVLLRAIVYGYVALTLAVLLGIYALA